GPSHRASAHGTGLRAARDRRRRAWRNQHFRGGRVLSGHGLGGIPPLPRGAASHLRRGQRVFAKSHPGRDDSRRDRPRLPASKAPKAPGGAPVKNLLLLGLLVAEMLIFSAIGGESLHSVEDVAPYLQGLLEQSSQILFLAFGMTLVLLTAGI